MSHWQLTKIYSAKITTAKMEIKNDKYKEKLIKITKTKLIMKTKTMKFKCIYLQIQNIN